MKIVRVEAIPVRVPLHAPLKMASATVWHRETILVRLTSDKGTTGVGDSQVAPYFTGETLPSALEVVDGFAREVLVGAEPYDITALNHALTRRIVGNPAARCAIDVALHDLVARSLGVPLYRLLGGRVRDSLRTIWHVSGSGFEENRESLSRGLEQGFTLFKLKVGSAAVDEDIAVTRELRAFAGDGVTLVADANQGWTTSQAIRYCRGVEEAGLSFVEQPVHRADINGLGVVQASSPIPVAADESVYTSEDLLVLVRANAVQAVTVKLMKSGGIAETMRLAALASTAGIGVHLAGMAGETSITAAAAVHVGVAMQQLEFEAGISPHYTKDDLVVDELRAQHGMLGPPQGPGLGVELADAAVERLRADASASVVLA